MGRFSVIAFGFLVARATSHDGHSMHGHSPPMSPRMTLGMSLVEKNCAFDVANLCAVEGPADFVLRDPILERITNPFTAAYPPMMDLSSIVNEMMEVAVRFADEQPSFVLIMTEDSHPKSLEAFDFMVTHLAERVTSLSDDDSEEEGASSHGEAPALDPVDFAKRLVEHGKKVLETEGNEERRLMARRLTEIRPDTFQVSQTSHHKRSHLPFGCPKNRCLMSAYEQGAVSPNCADALSQVEQLEQFEVTHHMLVAEREKETFFGLAILYGVLCVGSLLLLHRRLTKFGRRMHGKHRLKRRIIQAVYNNPEIKAAVAADLEEGLGNVPPLSPHELARMGGEDVHGNWRMMRALKLAVLIGVVFLALVNPFLAMPVMCVIVGIRFFQLAFCAPKMPKQSCCCCCCGLSTDDVKDGKMSTAQSCCCCCNGTGVPSPSCAKCCGSDGVWSADECMCCCCGVSADDAANGHVTAEQACCSCCKGTGKCCDSCAKCCGPTCGRPVRHAKEQAYMGIPVQVV